MRSGVEITWSPSDCCLRRNREHFVGLAWESYSGGKLQWGKVTVGESYSGGKLQWAQVTECTSGPPRSCQRWRRKRHRVSGKGVPQD